MYLNVIWSCDKRTLKNTFVVVRILQNCKLPTCNVTYYKYFSNILRAKIEQLFVIIIECRFTQKHIHDIVITYSQMHHTDSAHNTAQSFHQFGQMVECLQTKFLWVQIQLLSLKHNSYLVDHPLVSVSGRIVFLLTSHDARTKLE